MKTWTKQAEERFREYLDARVRSERLEADDAQELRTDLRMHVHEEAERVLEEPFGTAELERVLAGLETGVIVDGALPKRKKGRGWLIAFGVVLPLVISLFEIVTGFCGGVFFDPVPTFWHGILILLVPLFNGWLLTAGCRAGSRMQGLAAGMSMAVSVFYALLFLPLVPLSMIALIFFGMGLLSLIPVITGFASWRISRRNRDAVAQPWRFRQGWRIGVFGVIVLLFVLEAPGVWTRVQLSRAVSKNPERAEAGVERLRDYNSERTLLRACYEGNRGTSMGTDISGWLGRGWRLPLMMVGIEQREEPNSERARDVFFRATGKPFNSVKPPRMVLENSFFRGRGDAFEGIEFDDHLGGDSVAIRLKDLDLAESRFDGHVDGLSQIGYGEWTMVFRNGSSQAKEARCQLRLPRGGRVSRLTLWVNGEPREAAFNSVSKVKAAYQEVAVVQRRDPVLVTVAGPDTVMVQCFPVPPHGEMKIRFGVTAPLDGTRWELPRIVEQNFGVAAGAEHALWLQGDRSFEVSGGGGLAGSMKDGDGYSTHAVLPFEEIEKGPLVLNLGEVSERPEQVWCEDSFAEQDGRYLERSSRMGMRKPVDRLVVVIDGSVSMKGKEWRVWQVLSQVMPSGGVEILIADDGAQRVSLNELLDYDFSGGRDNEPALRMAVSMAKEGENGAVVWLHGPQSVELTKSEALLQLLERGTRKPKIYDVEMVAGPNRLSDSLGKAGVLVRGPMLVDTNRDLLAFLNRLKTGGPKVVTEWRRVGSLDEVEGKQVWDHLARLWAIEMSESDDPERAQIAANYQLVTPVSGAVVLETMEQYERHGLEPVDVDAAPSIPGVPEPSTSLLLVFGVGLGLLRRERKQDA